MTIAKRTNFHRSAIASAVATVLLAGCASFDVEAPPPLTLSAPEALMGVPIDATTRQVLSAEALIARLSEADVVILGEVHDNADHHALQAWIVEALHQARADDGGVDGLAFEMFPPSVAAEANAHLAGGGDAASLGDAIGWNDRGWPDWTLYAPIVAAAPGATLVGGAFEDGALRPLARDPSAWPDAARFGVLDALPADDQTAREAGQMAAHCDMLPAEMAPMMVMAQRLWDASFAKASLEALGDDGAAADDALAVLITGAQHARNDRGVPAALAAAAPEVSVAAVAFVEIDESVAAIEDVPGLRLYDVVIPTGAPERGDPCDAFKK